MEDGFDPDSTPITKEPAVTDRTTRRKKHRRKQKNIEEVEATTTFAQLSDRPATRRSEKVTVEITAYWTLWPYLYRYGYHIIGFYSEFELQNVYLVYQS